jgi:hypothetical protein
MSMLSRSASLREHCAVLLRKSVPTLCETGTPLRSTVRQHSYHMRASSSCSTAPRAPRHLLSGSTTATTTFCSSSSCFSSSSHSNSVARPQPNTPLSHASASRVRAVALAALGRAHYSTESGRETTDGKYISLDQVKFTTPSMDRMAATDAVGADELNWRLVGAGMVERLPLCYPEDDEAQQAYDELLAKRDADEWKVRSRLYKGVERETSVVEKTAAEFERRFGFLTAAQNSPEEEADLKNLQRHMNRRLYLIVKKSRSEHQWQFPQGGWESGETMREVSMWFPLRLRTCCLFLVLLHLDPSLENCLLQTHTHSLSLSLSNS